MAHVLTNAKEQSMKHDTPVDHPRRKALRQGFRIAGIAVAVLAIGANESAAAKATKNEVMYQDHRHDGKGCRECKSFIPAGGNADGATCALVEGVISPDGWCTAYAPR
jgi:hypothetical protein